MIFWQSPMINEEVNLGQNMYSPQKLQQKGAFSIGDGMQ